MPCAREKVMGVRDDAPRGAGHRDRSVLIVEDEFFIALALQSTVETLGYAVRGPFGRAEEALAALDEDPPDAALLDVQLLEETTAPVAKALRERHIPFLVLSGYDRDDLADPVLREAPLLSKPTSEPVLRRALSGLLA
jgi:CheY-like chemotaxis protein